MALQNDIDARHLTDELEPLISGTLVLMTAMQQTDACRLLPAKIASNLERLAVHPRLSAEFRMVLERLRLHWQARCGSGATGAPTQPSPCGRRVLH